jgi:hypothetical protein
LHDKSQQFKPIRSIKTGNKSLQVAELQRVLLKLVVDVAGVVVEPYLFCPGAFAAAFVVEKDNVCFYAGALRGSFGRKIKKVIYRHNSL